LLFLAGGNGGLEVEERGKREKEFECGRTRLIGFSVCLGRRRLSQQQRKKRV